ncbi:enoyl-CoA hydratase/isomerase family protein [Rhodobacter capsulatus]|uniref:enoyl-CoA hydratase/isomerase family protein n=1 Tax=Rhodobacter capsulatus TaxID=1061 RepID=UPI004027D0C3
MQATVPVVAVLSGTISGGALALSQAAGLRLALATTRFHCPEAGLNLCPPRGGHGASAAPRGRAALEVLLSGRVLDPAQAMTLGLCDAVASEGTIETAALTEALRVAALGPEAPFSPREGRSRTGRGA